MDYLPRVVDGEIRDALLSSGAVLVEGPKSCGKTATALQVAGQVVRLDLDRTARAAIDVDPAIVLRGTPPILLDEWQIAPEIWNYVRREVDDRSPAKGQFILTGSSVPDDEITRHSGAGRFAIRQMRPMSLYESGHSTGAISMSALLRGEDQQSPDPGLSVQDVVERIAVGGWPGWQHLSVQQATRSMRDYLTLIRDVDISRVGRTRRDPVRVGRVIESIARNVATEAAVTKIATDAGGAEGPIGRDTVAEYLDALGRLRIVEDQPAWNTHLRSRVAVRTSPKRHFVDPALAAAALQASPQRLMDDLNWTGFLFESMAVRDLRIYAQPLDGTVLHYRDNKGLEVDAIVQLADGRWGAFEMKMGQSRVDDAASSLLAFEQKVDTTRTGSPAVLGIITATGYGYKRPDGVYVIPIGALGP